MCAWFDLKERPRFCYCFVCLTCPIRRVAELVTRVLVEAVILRHIVICVQVHLKPLSCPYVSEPIDWTDHSLKQLCRDQHLRLYSVCIILHLIELMMMLSIILTTLVEYMM